MKKRRHKGLSKREYLRRHKQLLRFHEAVDRLIPFIPTDISQRLNSIANLLDEDEAAVRLQVLIAATVKTPPAFIPHNVSDWYTFIEIYFYKYYPNYVKVDPTAICKSSRIRSHYFKKRVSKYLTSTEARIQIYLRQRFTHNLYQYLITQKIESELFKGRNLDVLSNVLVTMKVEPGYSMLKHYQPEHLVMIAHLGSLTQEEFNEYFDTTFKPLWKVEKRKSTAEGFHRAGLPYPSTHTPNPSRQWIRGELQKRLKLLAKTRNWIQGVSISSKETEEVARNFEKEGYSYNPGSIRSILSRMGFSSERISK